MGQEYVFALVELGLGIHVSLVSLQWIALGFRVLMGFLT